jgi:pimeloyl-ACP methyl ester carboxylesterase
VTAIYVTAAGARAVEQRYREVLRLWPVPSEWLLIPTREGNTFVVACGPPDAPPLLASEAYALWLDDVLRELAVSRVSIVGVSLGGWLALDYAIRRPGSVDRLALLCPGGIGRQKWGVMVAAALLMPFGRWGLRTTMRLAAGGVLPAATPHSQEFADYLMLIHTHFRPRRDRLPTFDDDALSRLRMPVLVIVGGRDRMLDSFGTRRRLEQTVPHATVRLLPDAGHVLLGQSSVVLDFLK